MNALCPPKAFQVLASLILCCAGAEYTCAEDVQPIVIDVSGTRSKEEILASGFEYSELKGFTQRSAYHLPAAYVAWKFPGGTTIQHHMTLGSLDFQDGHLRHLSSHGEMMPLEEVMVLARKLHAMLGKPTDKLEKWANEEGAKGVDGDNHLFGVRDRSFIVDCEIRHSFGHVFPWALIIHASWSKSDAKLANLPLPFTSQGLVNLDPPSGKRYTAADDARLYQGKFGYTGPSSPTPWRTPRQEKPSDKIPAISSGAIKPGPDGKTGGGSNTYWWWWTGGAMLVVVLIVGLLKRPSSGARAG